MVIRFFPGQVCIRHLVDCCQDRIRNSDLIAGSQNQHILIAVKDLVVIHGRLLPLYTVPQNLHPGFRLQMLQSDPGIPLPFLLLRHGDPDLKQAVILQHAPVAHIAVRGVHLDNKLGVLHQTLPERIHRRVIQTGTVFKIPDGFHPEFSPDACFQDPPCGLFRLRRPLLVFQPAL